MKIDPSRGTFEEVSAGSSQAMMEIASYLRERIDALVAEVRETPRPAERHCDYAVAAERGDQVFAYLCPMNDYVRLGFYYGSALPDPAGLLVGEGKRLRHVKIRTLAEARRPEIDALLLAEAAERRQKPGTA